MKQCTKCGAMNADENNFCEKCANPLSAAEAADSAATADTQPQQPQQQSYGAYNRQGYANNYAGAQAQYQNAQQYQQPYQQYQQQYPAAYAQPKEESSIGKFILWFFLAMLPFPIGFIISIVFAFDSSNKPRRDCFAAYLIMRIIAAALVFLLVLIPILIMGPDVIEDIADEIQYYM